MGPVVVALAGPNGAGKSTTGPRLVKETLGITQFVNADVIAQGLAGFAPETAAFEAGRIMLRRLKELGASRESFAFETTLAGRSYLPLLRRLIDTGYSFAVVFLWLSNPELAVDRVAERVRRGGHSVPDAVVHRYGRGLRNLLRSYRTLADNWSVYDSSRTGPPRLVARGSVGCEEEIIDSTTWNQVLRSAVS